jgi:exo-1,4-beta-D-glucosaminidase
VEKAYLAVLREAEWSKPIVSNATETPGKVSGPSGVKMLGPYDYEPPSYWLTDSKHGGAFGFATEIGPGAAVPPLESLRKMLPPDKLWPPNEVWNLHAGSDEFKDVRRFTTALEARYGTARGVEDYARKAQALTYETQRAMFEGYARNKYTATGVIQWMLNNAWPGMIWHLYDYYLRPGGGYYGTRKACEPMHVQYSYDDRSVVVVSDGQPAARGLKVVAEGLRLDLSPWFSTEATVDVPADGVVRALVVPKVADGEPPRFLRLRLLDGTGRELSANFYWLAAPDDVLDWEKTEWFYTPTKKHADFTALASLPATTLALSTELDLAGPEGSARVTVENTGRALAFQVHLKLLDRPGGDELLPVFWDDNYFPLMPGERRTLKVAFPKPIGTSLAVEGEGWNTGPAGR